MEGNKHIKSFDQHKENLNISDVLSSKTSKLKCIKNGHMWSDTRNQKQHLTKKEFQKHGGWYSIGGFPETEERKCSVCGKIEQR